jgi:uncharacterized membrane protein YedE/YeeE
MNTHEYVMAAAGGALIGTASVILLWLNGRIAGISGIMNGAFSRTWAEADWRIAFVVGLITGGLIFQWVTGTSLMERSDYPIWLTIAAGLLVGYGTRLGSGCTSGHGICGIGRLSMRSIVATAIFVLVGMLVATGIGKVLL